MRAAPAGLLLLLALPACGEDPATPPASRDAPAPTANDEKPPVTTKANRDRLAQRIREKLNAGNRTPGMPHEMSGGDDRSALEAARRLGAARLGHLKKDRIQAFLAAAREISGADKDEHDAILQRHDLTKMHYRMIEAVFKRAEGIGPKLSSEERGLVNPYLETWRDVTESEK